MDLYDAITWFDDRMHFMNTGLLAGAIILLTMHRSSSLPRTVERGLEFGAAAAIGWEIAEYFAFVSNSSEREFAYVGTLSDLALGTLGAVVGACVVHALWQQGKLRETTPVPMTI